MTLTNWKNNCLAENKYAALLSAFSYSPVSFLLDTDIYQSIPLSVSLPRYDKESWCAKSSQPHRYIIEQSVANVIIITIGIREDGAPGGCCWFVCIFGVVGPRWGSYPTDWRWVKYFYKIVKYFKLIIFLQNFPLHYLIAGIAFQEKSIQFWSTLSQLLYPINS